MEFFQCVTNIITNTNRMILKETLNMYETPQFARAPSPLVDTCPHFDWWGHGRTRGFTGQLGGARVS